MRATVSVKQVADNAAAIRRAVAALTEQDVYIGVPGDNNARQDGGPTNAEIAYWQETGIPSRNVPARPALLPGMEDIRGEAAELLETAARKALAGQEGAVEAALNKIGLLGQNAVRARFVKNEWPPLKEETLTYQPLAKDDEGNVILDKKGRPLRKKSREERKRVNPRIDTGQNRTSYTYVIRKRGAAMITPGEK